MLFLLTLKLKLDVNLSSNYFFVIQNAVLQKCTWAAQNTLAGCMQFMGCRLRTPKLFQLHDLQTSNCTVMISIPTECVVIGTVMIQNFHKLQDLPLPGRRKKLECHKLHSFK
jgi:hypothetical protein